MIVGEFIELLIKELEINSELRQYYRLLNSNNRFLWRKAYIQNRLDYINSHITGKNEKIWDVGCGFATTSIFLAINGHKVIGNTLEYYYDTIQRRLDYWTKYANTLDLNIIYADLFDMKIDEDSYDAVILQDTLHHLEPIGEAIEIIGRAVKADGKIIVSEENGGSIYIKLKNIRTRGFKKQIAFYDEKLKKQVVMGNENARSLCHWKRIFVAGDLMIDKKHTEYIRVLPPFCYNIENYSVLRENEKKAAKKLVFLRDILYLGINFTAIRKPVNHERQCI